MGLPRKNASGRKPRTVLDHRQNSHTPCTAFPHWGPLPVYRLTRAASLLRLPWSDGELYILHTRGIALESVGSHSKTRALRTPKHCISCLALQKRPVPLVPWLASAQTRRDNTMRLYSSPPAHVPSLLTLCKKSVAHMRVEGAGDRVRPILEGDLDALGLARRALHSGRGRLAEHLAARAEHGTRLRRGTCESRGARTG